MEVSVQLSGSGVIAQHTEGSKAFPQLAAALEDEGQAAAAMEKARGEVAALFGARPGQVVFTSGGAESSNAAVKGLALALLRRGAPSRRLLLSEVEHAPVIHSALGLELVGFQVVKLGVGRCGRLDLEHFSRVLE
ncbi:MAG: aminotransferase class V-fold PLP-dependent enzyme, partial [Acidobacteriota bacterium]